MFGGGQQMPAGAGQPSMQEMEQMQAMMAEMVEKKFEAEMFSRSNRARHFLPLSLFSHPVFYSG